MTDALGWIARRAGTRGKYATVDAARVAVAGQSCGRLEAYQMRDDPRVQYLGIFNSGFLDLPGFLGGLLGIPAGERPETIEDLDLPVFDFLGGEEDIAYPNAGFRLRCAPQDRSTTDSRSKLDILRLFHIDGLLGWNSDGWTKYLTWSFIKWAGLTAAMNISKRKCKSELRPMPFLLPSE
ncbi:hypothetical protein BJX64DRAFT_288298 [Aspergillus heterothallicus]